MTTLLDNLVAYWKFDGNPADELGVSNGTATGVTYGTEKINSGARFTLASTSRVTLPAKLGHSIFSAAGWLRCAATVLPTSEGGFFADNGRGLYYNQPSNLIGMYDAPGGFYASGALPAAGTLFHFGVTLNGTTLLMYVNGALSATRTIAAWPPGGGGFWRFGNDAGGYQFEGSIDEWGYWANRVLTGADMTTLYNGGVGLTYAQISAEVIDPTELAYAHTLKQLLPPGAALKVEADGLISKTLLGAAREPARIDGRGVDLLAESDPRTAEEMIADWERVLGLPDEIITVIPATLADRRLAVATRFASRGGQSEAFFLQLCALCGYGTVTISDYQALMLRCGEARCGSELLGPGMGYAVLFTVSPPAGAALTHAELEAAVRHALHAHIQAAFVYL